MSDTDNKNQNTESNARSQIYWNENGQPVSRQFDDVYFSKLSGIEETRYVFLQGNDLESRWNPIEPTNNTHFSIAETGFGTGLNFLCAWQLWRNSSNSKHCNLHFCSVEKFPLAREELHQALQLWPELGELAKLLIAQYPPQSVKGFHRLIFDKGNVVLTIYMGDALEGFSQWLGIADPGHKVQSQHKSFGGKVAQIDAWFLDGFAPAKNPHMWTSALFSTIAQLSHDNTSFATFTSAGNVKRGLTEAGFNCQKIKGFANKREMLIGQLNPSTISSTTPSTTERPLAINAQEPGQIAKVNLERKYGIAPGREASWHLVSYQQQTPIETICVIGGGIAGCQTAFALANRNKKVILIEKNNSLASEASGNLQGAVYAKLSPHSDPLSQFNLTAQIFANQFYQHYDLFKLCGEQCGILHLASGNREHEYYRQLAEKFSQQKYFAVWVDKIKTANVAGLALNHDGLFIPGAGWLDPRMLCATLSKHPNITIVHQTKATQLLRQSEQWVVKSDDREVAKADAVIIASAHDALRFSQTSQLPLKQIRGQVTHLPANTTSQHLKTVICGEGYMAPATRAIDARSSQSDCDEPLSFVHTLGATFTLKNFQPHTNLEDHAKNLVKLGRFCPELKTYASSLKPSELDGRVGFRCATPDHFPIVGPVANLPPFIDGFARLRRNANTIIDSTGYYYPGLYCNVGYGSRGLCYTPICAELLASMICGELLPVARELLRYLHPGRFVVRDLTRRKI